MKKEKDKKEKEQKGFFAFTKWKIILAILLYLPSFIEFTNKNIFYYLYLLPTFLSESIVKILPISQADFIFAAILTWIIFLIINMVYVYLLSCIIIFLYNKLRK